MGYPMTYGRVVSRNGLHGDYDTRGVAINIAALPEWAQKEVGALAARFGMICGDLRRLERDVVDERAVCDHIAVKTGVDRDVVAGVLREFFAW